ncbi:MAG TPA: cytochrome c [Thermoanaerobaculia bacterium]|nr:cytochrome c [Thermoanaerobaculia bacterium]
MKLHAVLLIAAVTLAPAAFAADGAATYKAKCAACHGADGKGDSAMGKKLGLRDLGSPEVQKQTDQQLHDWTANGKGKMPAYKDKLSADEIKALVVHMRTFKK